MDIIMGIVALYFTENKFNLVIYQVNLRFLETFKLYFPIDLTEILFGGSVYDAESLAGKQEMEEN